MIFFPPFTYLAAPSPAKLTMLATDPFAVYNVFADVSGNVISNVNRCNGNVVILSSLIIKSETPVKRKLVIEPEKLKYK